MRQIKFRAFDKIENKMWVPAVFNDELYASTPFGFLKMDGELKDPLMQFTGLKDNNGVDIYEGDIVSTTYRGTNSTSKFKPKCVSWDVSKCGFNISKGIETEVIGNIYQNKELLNE